jgi:hypothetical protein
MKMLSEENIAKLKVDAEEAIKLSKTETDYISVANKVFSKMVEAKRKPVECAASAVGAIINDYRDSLDAFAADAPFLPGSLDDGPPDITDFRRPVAIDQAGDAPSVANFRRPLLNRKIPHSVLMSGADEEFDREIDVAGDMASSAKLVAALNSVDFDPATTRKEDVDRDFAMAVDPSLFVDDVDYPEPTDLLTDDVEAILDAASGKLYADSEIERFAGVDIQPSLPGTDRKPAAAPAKEIKPVNVTTAMLSDLMMDDD